MKRKSESRFTYRPALSSANPSLTRGEILRSARLQTLRQTCKLEDANPPDGRIKVLSGGSPSSNASIHSSSSVVRDPSESNSVRERRNVFVDVRGVATCEPMS